MAFWRDVVGHDGYSVSDDGRVRGPRGEMRLEVSRGGIRRVMLNRVHRCVHLLVLEAFVGPRPPGHHGDHIDFDHANNALSNLRWLPASENCRRHSPATIAKRKIAVSAAKTKHSNDWALAAVWCVLRLGKTQAETARAFGVRADELSRWCAGKKRPHLTERMW